MAGFEKHSVRKFGETISRLEPVVTGMADFAPGFLFQPPGRPTAIPAYLQIAARRLPANPGFLLNPPQRPTQLPQRNHLLPLRFAQDIATRPTEAACTPVQASVLAL
jgi:hypothetical protein